MVRTMLFVLLLAFPVFAQDATTAGLAAAGAGRMKFTSTCKQTRNTAQPEAGKALVYLIGDSWADHVAVHIGDPPRRFGVDGTWVGANGYRSYFFFPVDPGDHRLCTNMQSKLQSVVKSSTAARSFTAEAGKSYYFRTKTPDRPVAGEELELVPVDPAEAQVLLAGAAFSTFSLKK